MPGVARQTPCSQTNCRQRLPPLQSSAVLHWQMFLPLPQTPLASQVSSALQALSSSHALPASALCTQPPWSGRQALLVQGLPSSQRPSATMVSQPLPPAQKSMVQSMPSSQTNGLPTQLPPRQPADAVHGLPSSQSTDGSVKGRCWT